LGRCSLCEMPFADRSRCREGESGGAVAVHYVSRTIQSATEVILRTEK
jgi:hypothetical protein